MFGVLIVTHGNLGKELLATSAFIIGELEAAAVVSLTATESAEDIRVRMEEAINSVDKEGEGVVILTDMFGGTPANVALSFLDERKAEVITGVNLPMLLKVPSLRKTGKTLRDIAKDLAAPGQTNIIFASDLLGGTRGK